MRDALPVREQRLRTAFASYASQDRDAVLARVQGIQKALPSLDVFLDVASLRSGQRWKEQLASMPVVQAAAPTAPTQAPVGKAIPLPTNSAPRPVAPGQAVKSATTPPKASS